ncbi:8089_t:CDS:10 [Funneliformis geosporum]|uniref:Mediator of RNA polymerase II transcription subunit 14 n=1 Tax=Funneliformis geosporum TaxID=1117311 RepID=A0A9W4SU48_9GLOM|nr:8089_t:CDS:10 [Funneliformis geosporum]CAI2180739.1 19660_t:CDS:10 [Funneliformis geosporum]
MDISNNIEIQRSHSAKLEHWKPLTEVVDAVNGDAYDRLATFIHKPISEPDTDRRKAFMISYLLPQRSNWLKLKTLVSWSEKADLVRDYELHYEAVQSQKNISSQVERSMHDWSFFMPSSSLRSPDIINSSDVLKEGTYKRFPSMIKERFAPDILNDDEAKETLEALNGIIQLRILTQEIIPECMRNYSISNGKIKFLVDKEFEVVLTLCNIMEINELWWMVDLNFLIQSASDRTFNDVKFTFHDDQLLRLKGMIQTQFLSPPPLPIPERITSSMKHPAISEASEVSASLQAAKFCPLVNLYEYLHNYCLDLQLNILFQQAVNMKQTRWINNFEMLMNEDESVLRIFYWSFVKQPVPAQINMRPNVPHASNSMSSEVKNHDIIEISVITEESDRPLLYSSKKTLKRAHWYTDTKYVKLGALNDTRGINYPHKVLRVRWTGLKGYEANEWIVVEWKFDPTNLNIEHLMLSITQQHACSIIDKFVEILKNDEAGVYTENDFEIVNENNELVSDSVSAESSFSDEVARKYLMVPKLRIRLCGDSKNYYIKIGIDTRSGRIFIEDENQGIEHDKIKFCENKLSYDHNCLIDILIMLRSIVMIPRLESTARKLFLDVPQEIILDPDERSKLYTTQNLILEFYDVKDFGKMLSRKVIPDKGYYLIAGMVANGIVYSLATFSRLPPTKKYLLDVKNKEPTHRITSIQTICLGNTIFDKKSKIDDLSEKSTRQFLKYSNLSDHTRKRSFDKMKEDEIASSPPRSTKRTFEISETNFNSSAVEELLLARIVAIARARIDYEKVEACFNEKEVKLEPVRIREQIKAIKRLSPEVDFDKEINKSLDFLDSNAPLSLSTTIPTFKINIRSLLARFPRANDFCLNIFSDVFVRLAGARLTKTTNPEVILTTCLQSRYLPRMVDVFLNTNIIYDQPSGILTFRYDYNSIKNFVDTFLEDFEEIVMVTQAACECKRIFSDKKRSDINILNFDFDTLKLQYYPYGADISWRKNEYTLVLHDFATEYYTKKDFSNPHKDKLFAFLKEELNSAYVHNFNKFIDSLRIVPSVVRFLDSLSIKDDYSCELQVIPKGAIKFHLIWGYSISPNGQQTWCGMDISFVQAEDDAYFFASDLTNLKEYRSLKPEKMPIWQAFGQEFIKQEVGLKKVEMLTSGFKSPVNVNFEKIMSWIDENVRKRFSWNHS